MAEVIEINLICKNKLNQKVLFSFMNSNAKGNLENRTIEIIDNWEDENRTIVSSDADISDYIEDKIICITEKYSSGYVGLDIESVNQKYCYTIWFNIADYDEADQYILFMREFISYYKEIFGNNCILCSVGKEVIFEYKCDYYKTICNSHNIDVFIILSAVYDNIIKKDTNINSKYKISKQDGFVLLCKPSKQDVYSK